MCKEKVLLDTDIGTNIDDAACLAYLLCQECCELLGVTTVTGRAGRRAALADALATSLGHDIPVCSGAEKPLLGDQVQTEAPQADLLKDRGLDYSFRNNRAVRFMREALSKNPGEVTILAVGPLTNVALLFALERNLPNLAKRVVMMNGCFSEKKIETNASLDPHAAAIVYGSEIQELWSIGFDVTRQCSVNREWMMEVFFQGQSNLLEDLVRSWWDGHEHMALHDPLAAATIFRPDLCSYSKHGVEVELCEDGWKGRTSLVEPANNISTKIATGVDRAEFLQHYRRVLISH
ncbi:MAG: nucleoside hydrolase [Candidatus Bipolaricaulota bacterium]